MKVDLDGRVAIVLGAVKGIGKEIGLSLAEKGASLALTHFDWEESLPDMKKEFADTGCDHMIEKINLLDTDKIGAFVSRVEARYGRLDILINNIERGGWPVVHGPYVKSQWDLEMETTLRAKRWMFDAALPLLKKTGNASVINISSIAGMVGRTGPAGYVFNDGYSAANRGLSLLTETWARIGAPEIRVNEIMLGFFESRHAENTRGWGLLSEDQKKNLVDHILLKRTGRYRDVISAVMFILCGAPYMTGSVIRLDGGYVLGGEGVPPMPAGVV